MRPVTSTQFASAIAAGTDWRDTSKTILEQLEGVKTSEHSFNFGFLYVSDYLADDLSSILNLFKSVLDIENWVGSIGLGVCGNGREYIDTPAISAMVGWVDPDDFTMLPLMPGQDAEEERAVQDWLDTNDPMMVYVHGDPMAEENQEQILNHIEHMAGGYIVGGLSSGRTKHFQIANDVLEGGYSGAAFSQNIPVASTLTQGCAQYSTPHTITNVDDFTIFTLDDKPALDMLEQDIRTITMKKTNIDPQSIKIDESAAADPQQWPPDVKTVLKGEVLAALPVPQSDQGDYLVRNIMHVDEDSGAISVAHPVSKGDRITFVYRDDETVRADLTKSLLNLRDRVSKSEGQFAPKAALYISCVARAFSDFHTPQDDDASVMTQKAADTSKPKRPLQSSGEMALIQEIIGDVPLSGYYAAGEINAGRLYGYSGILILFL